MKLSVQFGTPRLGVKFGTPSLGVSTGNLIIRKGEETPPYTGDYTVTPSTTAQTLPTGGKKMTDNVTFEAMPQGYVALPMEAIVGPIPISVSDSGKISVAYEEYHTITPEEFAPGYIESIESGFYEIELSGTKQLSTQSALEITPSVSTQTFNTLHKYMMGNVVVNPIPLQSILIRPDAEKIKTYSNDSLVVTDDEVTLPDYNSSKAVTIKASANLSGTVTLDFDNYNYFVIERFLTTPVYNTNTPVVSRNEYSIGTVAYELLDIPANTFSAANGTKYASRAVGVAAYTGYRLLYWSSASAVGVYTSTTYGIHQVTAAPSISSGKLTVKSPTLQFRGSSSYLTSAVYGTITDIRRQFVIDVYRSPKGTLNIDGWGLNQQALSILNDVNNNNGKLR